MSTIAGIGKEYDKTFKADSSVKTTTSQYRVVSMQNAGNSSDFTVKVGATSTVYNFAIGINQTYMSSGSEACSVRMFGISKAIAGQSVSAGDFVKANSSGAVVPILVNGSTLTIASTTSQVVVIGRALESGSTNTVISVFVNPQVFDGSFV